MIETTLNSNVGLMALNGRVNELATEMVEGFDMVYGRIDEKIDNLRVEMNSKFKAIDEKLQSIDKKFDAIDKRFEVIDKRFERLETDMDLIKKHVLVMSASLVNIEKHLSIKNATISP